MCIFAYGQSGTGKTFTMDGTDEKPGLVPRAMGGVFSVIGERQARRTHAGYTYHCGCTCHGSSSYHGLHSLWQPYPHP